MQPDAPLLSVHGLRDKKTLRGLSLHVYPGQFVCLLSEDELELTRAVKIIAGWESPAEGDVFFRCRKITNDWLGRKKLCYVSRGAKPLMSSARDEALLEGMGISPHSLSAEDRHAALSIARALALKPELLVIDQRADSLPAGLRAPLLAALREAAGAGMGILYATNQKDTCPLADQVYLTAQGRVIQSGAFSDLYEQPASLRAARMTGGCILLSGQVAAVKGDRLLFSAGGLSIPCRSKLWLTPGERLTLCLRPEWLLWDREGDPAFSPPLRARLIKAEPCTGGRLLAFELPGGRTIRLERSDVPGALRRVGEQYLLRWDMDKALLLAPDDEDI